MKSDFQIVQQFKKHRQISERGLTKQYENTKECEAFYAGDFMSYRDQVQFADPMGRKKKAMVQFNKVKPYVNAVKGFMAQNRRRSKYIARVEAEPLRNLYSKYTNALADYVRENANADQVETQQDGDMLICGYGAVETNLTYGEGYASRDPNGEVLMMRLDPHCVGWDPHAAQPNLLDKRWVFYGQDYVLDEALSLFDKSEPDDFESSKDDSNAGFSFNPAGGTYDKIKEGLDWSDEEAQLVKVYFYQWYEIETFYRAQNPIFTLTNPEAVQLAMMTLESIAAEQEDSGLFEFNPRAEILTFDSEIKKKLIESFGEFIKPYDFKKKVFYTAVLSGEKVFTKFQNVCQQGYTIKFKTGDYDAKNKIWMGMVNSMKDPVLYYNKALTELMFVIGANSKGGVLVERGAVDDISEFEQKYAKTDSVIEVNEGALSGGKVQPKKSPFTPTGYEDVIQLSDASISDVNGIDKSFLGSSENRQETAMLQRQRIKQVTSSLACYFDAITLYQKEHARLLIDLMRVYVENNDGSLFRIVGEDGKEEFLKIAADKFVNEYDVSIQEAPQTVDEKQEFANTLVTMADKLIATGDQSAKQIYAVALKYLPIDTEDKQKLTEILVPQNQVDPAYVQQLEQQLQELNSEMNKVQLDALKSSIRLNSAKVDETMAKVQKTAAETVKVMEEAEQKGVENKILGSAKDLTLKETRVVI
jgi:hypothetical protein